MPGMGFRLARSMGMEGTTGNLHEYPIAPGNSTAIFRGDLVSLNAGFVEAGAAALGTKYLGIFWGCKYEAADGSVEHKLMWDGGSGRSNIKAQVVVLPAGATALVKGEDGETYTDADIGTRKPFIANAGDTRTGMSRATLGAAGASVATAGLIVLSKPDIPDGGDWFEVALAADSSLITSGP